MSDSSALIQATALKPRVRYRAEEWPQMLERMSAPAYPRRAVEAWGRLTEDFRVLIVEVRCSDGCLLVGGARSAGRGRARAHTCSRALHHDVTLDQIADTLVADMREKLLASFCEFADELEASIRAQVVHGMPLCMPAIERPALLH